MINRKMIAKGMTAVSLFTAFMTVVPSVVSAQSTMEKRPQQISATQMKQQPGMNRQQPQQGNVEKNRDSQPRPEMQQGKQNPQVKKNDQKPEMKKDNQKPEMKQNNQKPEMKQNDKKDGRNTTPDRKPSSNNKNDNAKMNQNNRPMPQGQQNQGQGQMPAPESMPRR
jgi:hypothetical protein